MDKKDTQLREVVHRFNERIQVLGKETQPLYYITAALWFLFSLITSIVTKLPLSYGLAALAALAAIFAFSVVHFIAKKILVFFREKKSLIPAIEKGIFDDYNRGDVGLLVAIQFRFRLIFVALCCVTAGMGGCTRSDAPQKGLSAAENRFLTKVGQLNDGREFELSLQFTEPLGTPSPLESLKFSVGGESVAVPEDAWRGIPIHSSTETVSVSEFDKNLRLIMAAEIDGAPTTIRIGSRDGKVFTRTLETVGRPPEVDRFVAPPVINYGTIPKNELEKVRLQERANHTTPRSNQ